MYSPAHQTSEDAQHFGSFPRTAGTLAFWKRFRGETNIFSYTKNVMLNFSLSTNLYICLSFYSAWLSVIYAYLNSKYFKLGIFTDLICFFLIIIICGVFLCHCVKIKDGSELEVEMKWSRQHGNAFSIQLGPFDSYVSIHHPDYAKTLVSSSGKLGVGMVCESLSFFYPSYKPIATRFLFRAKRRTDLHFY